MGGGMLGMEDEPVSGPAWSGAWGARPAGSPQAPRPAKRPEGQGIGSLSAHLAWALDAACEAVQGAPGLAIDQNHCLKRRSLIYKKLQNLGG